MLKRKPGKVQARGSGPEGTQGTRVWSDSGSTAVALAPPGFRLVPLSLSIQRLKVLHSPLSRGRFHTLVGRAGAL